MLLLPLRKALQIAYLRAAHSVSETAVGARGREAQSGRSLHSISELLVLDSDRELGGSLQGFLGRLGNVCSSTAQFLGGRLREVADRESQRLRRTFAELLAQPLLNRGGKLAQFERPSGGGRVDVQRAVATDPGGP